MGGTGVAGGTTVAWGVGSDVGLTRTVNEDSVLADPPFFVVADGMGGHDAGDVASALVVDRFRSLASTDSSITSEQVAELLGAVNQEIFVVGGESGGARSMGTTAVGLVLVENGSSQSWMLFNVGDSRAYRLAAGELELLSVDHSYVQELLEAGAIRAEDARDHPQRNVVTRALGVERAVEADLWLRLPELGERFLLCSDGLNSELRDDEIAQILSTHVDPAAAASSLVSAALSSGGRDNVTVLVVDVVGVDDALEHVTAPREEPTREHQEVRSDDRPVSPTPSEHDHGSDVGARTANAANLIDVPEGLVARSTANEGSPPESMIEAVPMEWSDGASDMSDSEREGDADD